MSLFTTMTRRWSAAFPAVRACGAMVGEGEGYRRLTIYLSTQLITGTPTVDCEQTEWDFGGKILHDTQKERWKETNYNMYKNSASPRCTQLGKQLV
jgi:hypothetical protein